MKIAVWHNLPSGGGKRALWDHVEGLLKRGHQVESWCPSTASQDFLPLSRLCTEHVLPFNTHRLKGALGVWRLLKEIDAHCRECARQIENQGFDILFANSCAFFATSPIGRYVRIPKVLYLQEPRREFYEAMPKLLWLDANSIKRRAIRAQIHAEIANAAAFDRILVNSEYSRESLLRAYGLDSHVCYLGVDSERFRPSTEPTSDYLIGLGSMQYLKGLDRAVKAIGAIPYALRPKLLWVGNAQNANYVDEIHGLAKSLGVTFETKQMVSDEELISLLSRAISMLYTSRLEPFGFAPLEANACGVPVVAIAEGGVRETVIDGENGFLVSDADPGMLAAALTGILSNRPLAREMGLKARDIVISRWSLDASTARLEQALLLSLESKRVS